MLSLLCLVTAEHLGTMIVQCCRANCTLVTRNCGTDAVLSGSGAALFILLRWSNLNNLICSIEMFGSLHFTTYTPFQKGMVFVAIYHSIF